MSSFFQRVLTFGLASLVLASSAQASSSWVPFGGYNPTYGAFLGGGYFYKNPTFDFGSAAIITFVSSYQLDLNSNLRTGLAHEIGFESKISQGYERYYGLGTRNSPNGIDIFNRKVRAALFYSYAMTSEINLGFMTELRTWREIFEKNPRAFFPQETTAAVSVFLENDYRDREASPTGGTYSRIDLRVVPSLLASDQNFDLLQLDAEIRRYFQIIESWVLAMAVRAGASSGEPTLRYQYQLGGSDRLRGYHQGRFRGRHFYALETEVRFPLFWHLRGAVFGSAGSVFAQGLWGPTRYSGGFGLRLGLPPDFIQKARVDIAFGEDQWGVFVDFGLPF